MSDLAPIDDQLRHLSSALPTSDRARGALRELIDSLLDDRLQIMAARRPKVKCSMCGHQIAVQHHRLGVSWQDCPRCDRRRCKRCQEPLPHGFTRCSSGHEQ